MRAQDMNKWIQLLCDSADESGAFSYHPNKLTRPEPTALAAIAILAHDRKSQNARAALNALVTMQTDAGPVLVSPQTPRATWPTALAILAWNQWPAGGGISYDTNIDRAVTYLLTNEGTTFQSNPHIYGHDTQIVGWPWIEGTHSWLEPTASAVLALRAIGQGDRPRAQEARDVLYDRAITAGGWNYGNSRIFGADLRPFPATTGMVLASLADQPRDETIERALSFLRAELESITSLFSLAWGVIGWRCWESPPDSVTERIRSILAASTDPTVLELALSLIALAPVNPFEFGPSSERAERTRKEAILG